ncbi:hypothetical protein [Oryza sativa Japonica Group]|uniref:Uncharacterized protein P0501G01.13 n=1 Tax=Oryza sativa subsp. japonica TaxID=39947 RepID=Q5ZE71_ORYSJ|nr:hypothetical protein [Oryza sativa Japonica Group]
MSSLPPLPASPSMTRHMQRRGEKLRQAAARYLTRHHRLVKDKVQLKLRIRFFLV